VVVGDQSLQGRKSWVGPGGTGTCVGHDDRSRAVLPLDRSQHHTVRISITLALPMRPACACGDAPQPISPINRILPVPVITFDAQRLKKNCRMAMQVQAFLAVKTRPITMRKIACRRHSKRSVAVGERVHIVARWGRAAGGRAKPEMCTHRESLGAVPVAEDSGALCLFAIHSTSTLRAL